MINKATDDIMATGKLVGSDKVLQSEFLEQVQAGVDTQLSVFLHAGLL